MKAIIFLLSFITCSLTFSTQALKFSNEYCNSNTGEVQVLITGSVWDSVYHDTVTIKIRSQAGVWKEKTFDFIAPGKTYATDIYELGLSDAAYYKVVTGQGPLIVDSCD